MALPQAGEAESLRRRFPHFSSALLEMLEACLQVGSAGWGWGSRAYVCGGVGLSKAAAPAKAADGGAGTRRSWVSAVGACAARRGTAGIASASGSMTFRPGSQPSAMLWL